MEMEEEEAEAAGGWADEDAKHPDEEFGSSQVGWKFYSGSGGEARAAFSLARPRLAVPAMASQSSLAAAAAMSEEDAMEAAMEAARVRGAKAAAVHVDATGEAEEEEEAEEVQAEEEAAVQEEARARAGARRPRRLSAVHCVVPVA